jgi:hypothetical protein
MLISLYHINVQILTRIISSSIKISILVNTNVAIVSNIQIGTNSSTSLETIVILSSMLDFSEKSHSLLSCHLQDNHFRLQMKTRIKARQIHHTLKRLRITKKKNEHTLSRRTSREMRWIIQDKTKVTSIITNRISIWITMTHKIRTMNSKSISSCQLELSSAKNAKWRFHLTISCTNIFVKTLVKISNSRLATSLSKSKTRCWMNSASISSQTFQ